MLNFTYYCPTLIEFGKDTQQQVGDLVKRFGGTKVLLHYGGKSAESSGLLAQVRASLKASELEFVELGGVQPNPRLDLVYQGIDLARQEQVDFVLAVGGGSVLDSAKAISMGIPYDGDVWDLFETRGPIEEVTPLGTIITLPATGSEASNSTVINNQKQQKKYGYRSDLIRPLFSIMNPELTYTLPAYQVACGAVDMISHILERYFSNTPDCDFTDRQSEAALKSIIENTLLVFENPKNYAARANMFWAGTIAHNNILGVGKEQDWSSHAIEHELSALYDVAHGAGLATVLPAYMKYTLPQHVMRYAQLAHRVWDIEMNFQNPEETARQGIDAFEDFFATIGMPTTFKQLGANEEDIPYLAQHCRLNNGDKLGYFQPLNRSDIAKIYQLCL